MEFDLAYDAVKDDAALKADLLKAVAKRARLTDAAGAPLPLEFAKIAPKRHGMRVWKSDIMEAEISFDKVPDDGSNEGRRHFAMARLLEIGDTALLAGSGGDAHYVELLGIGPWKFPWVAVIAVVSVVLVSLGLLATLATFLFCMVCRKGKAGSTERDADVEAPLLEDEGDEAEHGYSDFDGKRGRPIVNRKTWHAGAGSGARIKK